MIEDTSLEFDMFEDIRRKLADVFMREGRARLEAEQLALYVVQGVRDVPKLLAALTEESAHADAEILYTVGTILENASALYKAREMLLGLDPEDVS
jgi:hypothetical protein